MANRNSEPAAQSNAASQLETRPGDSSAPAPPAANPALPPDQRRAIELLTSGRSIKTAARELNVSRTTVYRWLHEDAEFIAAYNAWNDELQESARARLASMVNSAVDAVGLAIRKRDTRAAMELLKTMGVMAPRPSGPQDAAEIRRRQEIEARNRAAALLESDNAVYRRESKAGDDRPFHIIHGERPARNARFDADQAALKRASRPPK